MTNGQIEEKSKIEIIHKTLQECIDEIEEYEAMKKPIVGEIKEEDVGVSVHTFSLNYNETLADIKKFQLIKNMTDKFKKRKV